MDYGGRKGIIQEIKFSPELYRKINWLEYIMKRLFLVVIGVIAILAPGSYFLSSSHKDKIRNYPSNGTDIIAFGDSLVEGVGSTPGYDFVSLLSQKIGEPIINLGRSGNTTAQGRDRLSELDKYQPRIVLVLFGGNDHLQKVPIEQTFINLRRIIEDIQGRGAIVILLGVRGNLFGDKFAAEFAKLKDKYETAYVPDVLSRLFGHAQYMSDEIHPNDAGYAIIADRIYPILDKLRK